MRTFQKLLGRNKAGKGRGIADSSHATRTEMESYDMKTRPRSKPNVRMKDLKPKKSPKGGRQTPKTDFGTVLGTGVSTPPP